MKKNLLLALAGCGLVLASANTVKAQSTPDLQLENKNYYLTSWKNNWYIQLGAGMQVPFTDHWMTSGDSKRHITAIYNVGVGHWFSPYLGFRLTGYYGRIHTEWMQLNRANMLNANFDLTWDMFNSICGPNENRVFSIIPFVGVGATYTWDFNPALAMIPTDNGKHLKTKEVTLPVSAGLQFRFRLSKYVDFFAEARANLYGDNFDNVASGDPIECNLAVYGGFNINFGGRKYSAFNPYDYVNYINTLNNEINDLQALNATTAAALAATQAELAEALNRPCPPEQVVVETPLLATVRFKLNSAVITPEEEVNVYVLAKWLQDNPEANVIVGGYADKDTGTAAYNMKLSQRRAEAVVNQLVNKYGINSSRLTIQAFGSDVQPFDEKGQNNWNRIVILEQNN